MNPSLASSVGERFIAAGYVETAPKNSDSTPMAPSASRVQDGGREILWLGSPCAGQAAKGNEQFGRSWHGEFLWLSIANERRLFAQRAICAPVADNNSYFVVISEW